MKKGISLIVLVITIIVMAILAATAIIALEDGGIINRSKDATRNSNYNDEYTRLMVIKNGLLTDNLGTITVEEYVEELKDKGWIENNVIVNSNENMTVNTKTGWVVNIVQDGIDNLIINLGTEGIMLSLNPKSMTVDVTEGTVVKNITITSVNVEGEIRWETSNSNVAVVSGNNSGAVVTIKNSGSAVIKAIYNNISATCNITAIKNVTCQHTNTRTETSPATCMTPGNKIIICNSCGYSYTETIPATGIHVDIDKNNKCDNCNIGLATYASGTLVFKTDKVAYLYGENEKILKTYTGWYTAIYTDEIETPWYKELKDIKAAVIEDGVSPTSTSYWLNLAVNLESLTIGNSVKTIGDYAFANCEKLSELNWSYGTTTIGHASFMSSNLESITIPSSVKTLGDSAFIFNDNLKTVVINGSITSWGEYVFASCDNLANVTIKNGTTKIGDYAFQLSAIKSITIPNSVVTIGRNAFCSCTQLKNITLGTGIRQINQYVFYESEALTSINYLGTISQWNSISKNYYWNQWSSLVSVICSDGTVSL